jgi:DNA-directed RNA polymerase delta subunit
MNKNSSNKQHFFGSAFESLTTGLPLRSQEIIKARYGIDGGKPATLEEIGKKYQITRERVRQIIADIFKKIEKHKNSSVLEDVRNKIVFTIKAKSGIIRKEKAVFLLSEGHDGEVGCAEFFLELLEDISVLEVVGEMEKSLTVSGFNFEHWKEIKDAAITALKKANDPLEASELFKKSALKEKEVELEKFLDFIDVSAEVRKNSFEKWGLAGWKEITPKGTREKAYLVLKENKKPLHFRKIAELIDKYSLNKKKTHPQTVHNELIKDESFVLVGRGIYALKDWGYKKGTVKTVLEDILKRSDSPMKKDEILAEVLNIRQVKKSTVIINLNNFFQKVEKDKYTLKK